MEYDNLPIVGRINMAVIIEPIIKNIRDTKVKIFLESKGIKESENDDRLELSAWLEHL